MVLSFKGNIIYNSSMFSSKLHLIVFVLGICKDFFLIFCSNREIKMQRNAILPNKTAKFSCNNVANISKLSQLFNRLSKYHDA